MLKKGVIPSEESNPSISSQYAQASGAEK